MLAKEPAAGSIGLSARSLAGSLRRKRAAAAGAKEQLLADQPPTQGPISIGAQARRAKGSIGVGLPGRHWDRAVGTGRRQSSW